MRFSRPARGSVSQSSGCWWCCIRTPTCSGAASATSSTLTWTRPWCRPRARSLPNNPRLIEAAVEQRIVPYAYDWQVNGVPWYFPTAAEAMREGRGDCESRAIVLASIFKAKGIPYQLRMSFDHIWVDYPGKRPNAIENDSLVFAERKGGHFVFHWPKQFHLGQEISDQLAVYWTPMPGRTEGRAAGRPARFIPLLNGFGGAGRQAGRLGRRSCRRPPRPAGAVPSYGAAAEGVAFHRRSRGARSRGGAVTKRVIDLRSDTVTRPSPEMRGRCWRPSRRRRARRRPHGHRPAGVAAELARQTGRALLSVGHDVQPGGRPRPHAARR